ncbi:MAG: hypothetical protein ACP5QR_05085 [Rhizomicrobium sp.]
MAEQSVETLISERLEALCRQIGPKAHASVSLSFERGYNECPHGALYPFGILGKENIHVSADTLLEAIDALEAQWADHCTAYYAETTRKIAHAIIEITHRTGECSDRALCAEFDPSEVARFGADAVELANTMAANGPFSITHIDGNAEAA